MSEPVGNVIVEDDEGSLWRRNSEGLWLCQTDRGWVDSWESLLLGRTIVAVFIDRDEIEERDNG